MFEDIYFSGFHVNFHSPKVKLKANNKSSNKKKKHT